MNNIQNHNTDCFFFTNVQDMGANIPAYSTPDKSNARGEGGSKAINFGGAE